VHIFKQRIVKEEKYSSSDEGSKDGSESASPVKFNGRFNAAQFVLTRTMIPKSAVKKTIPAKTEANEATEDKGESFSMEDWLNSKDFHKIASIKPISCEDTPEWYDMLVSHDEMRGMSIAPWESIASGLIMGH
jgi:hypothetical protein